MRIRLRFAKEGRVRFLSHRDIARIWERSIRRAELPIAYSEGFSPRPKVHFGLALSVGHESRCEYLDIDVRDPVDPAALPAQLSPLLPDGLSVLAAVQVADFEPSLQSIVDVVTWGLTVDGDVDKVADAARELLAQPTIPVTVVRKGTEQQADLRPAVLSMSVELGPYGTEIRCDLATKPKSFRPSEVLAAFTPPMQERRVRRIEQWIIDGDVRRVPLPLPADDPAGVDADAAAGGRALVASGPLREDDYERRPIDGDRGFQGGTVPGAEGAAAQPETSS